MRVRLILSRSLPVLAAVLFLVGAWKGWRSVGDDFRVFDHAARLAFEGRAEILYRDGPDRFLYAPGFAYLLAPLALLPYAWTHTLWMIGMCVAGFFAARLLERRTGSRLAVAVGFLFLMRPIWIDLRYGQVNLLILVAAMVALFSFSAREGDPLASRAVRFWSWFFFSIAAFAKIYPLALFLVPLLGIRDRKKFLPILGGAVAGFAVLGLLPLLFANVSSAFIYGEWYQALLARGFPLDTHNQSLLAVLQRVFSGEIIRSHFTGGEPMLLAGRLLADEAIRTLFGAASVGVAILFVRSAWRVVRGEDADLAIGLCLALCFLPAHLIWKSYFLLALPLVVVLYARFRTGERGVGFWIFWFLFAVMHGSSVELIGRHAAAWYEAFGGMLFIHFGFVALACGQLYSAFPHYSNKNNR